MRGGDKNGHGASDNKNIIGLIIFLSFERHERFNVNHESLRFCTNTVLGRNIRDLPRDPNPSIPGHPTPKIPFSRTVPHSLSSSILLFPLQKKETVIERIIMLEESTPLGKRATRRQDASMHVTSSTSRVRDIR